MNRICFIITAAFVVLLAAVSCKKEDPSKPKDDFPEVKYTVVKEDVLTLDSLFEKATGPLQDIPDIGQLSGQLSNLKECCQSCGGQLSFKLVTVTYPTKDESDKEVEASALIIYPLDVQMDKVMLINHGTHIGSMMVPTNYTAVESILAATGSLCILPDYIGVGLSSSHKDLYLNAEVHGTTSTDALFVLLAYAQRQKLQLSDNYGTYVIGYSQGGSVSLATLREIQTRAADRQEKIRLKKVVCGDGPYDLRCTFEEYQKDYEDGKAMGLGAVIPNVINSMFNSYPDELKNFQYEQFFTEWALFTGVPQAIRNNTVTAMEMIVPFMGCDMGDILDMEYLQDNPDAYNTLLSMMDRQNLCEEWIPAYPLHFLHCNPDGIVPYRNFKNAYAGLKDGNIDTPETIDVDFLTSPLLQHCYGMFVLLSNALQGEYY